jgi:hypothetical protein
MLKKHTGESNDTKGCEFGYTCYSDSEYGFKSNGEIGMIHDRTYVDDVFGIEAKSLNELKIIIGEK